MVHGGRLDECDWRSGPPRGSVAAQRRQPRARYLHLPLHLRIFHHPRRHRLGDRQRLRGQGCIQAHASGFVDGLIGFRLLSPKLLFYGLRECLKWPAGKEIANPR